jgi:uncharacterized protein (TIRG00374 family)
MSSPAENSPTPNHDDPAIGSAGGKRASGGLSRWLKFALRWGIAALGIWWVLANLSLHDRVLIAGPDDGWPVSVRLVEAAKEESEQFKVRMPDGSARTLRRDELLVRADPVRVTVDENGVRARYDQLARKVVPADPRERWPIVAAAPRNLWQRFWNLHTGPVRLIDPTAAVAPRDLGGVPYPIVEQGLLPMLRNADPAYLVIALGIFPIVYFITAWRWHVLLKALSIYITFARALQLNMVGAFYNTFMPGSTGGDLLKAWYIAKHTKLRTRAVMSVIVDRILGLLSLIIMGGTVATVQWTRLPADDPAKTWCGRVALGALLICAGTVGSLVVFYHPTLRRITGLAWFMRRLPMQTQVNKAVETMEIYRRRPWLVLWAIVVTFPVHATVVVSATFAGLAFGLPLPVTYYWVVVPVVVLAGAIPISPQGAGVMEFFAILLTRRQGATVSQAFALTMSIRLVQILWNLVGGIFVVRGNYHAPTEREAEELTSDTAESATVELTR